MNQHTLSIVRLTLLAGVVVLLALLPQPARAHCDALDGPVVVEARQALAAGDLQPLLKWIDEEDEAEVRGAFEQTLEVRALGEQARALADRYFFETLVRLHRASEGAPYTGLKPAGSPVDEAVRLTDHALEVGEAAPLVEPITRSVRHGLTERFEKAAAAKARADESVEAGREFVHAYVELVHYAKAIRLMAEGHGGAHGHGEAEGHGDMHASHAGHE